MLKNDSGDLPGGVIRDGPSEDVLTREGVSHQTRGIPGLGADLGWSRIGVGLLDTDLVQTPSLQLAKSPDEPRRLSEARFSHLQSENYNVHNEEYGGESHEDTFNMVDFK